MYTSHFTFMLYIYKYIIQIFLAYANIYKKEWLIWRTHSPPTKKLAKDNSLFHIQI